MRPSAPAWSRVPDGAWRLLLAAILLVVYAATLLPGPGYAGDTTKFQFLGKVLGTPHTSGYPLYMVLNHLFVTALPVGSLAFRANLLSAVCAAGAIALAFGLLRALDVRRPLAFAAAFAAGLAPTFWGQAIVAEVYALNAVFVMGTLWAFLRWERTRRDRDLFLASAVYALSFGNHLTMITLLPALAVFVALVAPAVYRRPKTVLGIGAIAALGALQYGYIVWRTFDPATPYVEMVAPDLATFWWYITGAQFKGALFAFSPEAVLHNRLPWYAKTLLAEFLVLPLAVAALGAIGLDRRRNALLMLAFAGSAAFAINYDIVDVQAYFIPSFLIAALYVGLGMEWAASRLPRPFAGAWLAACLALPVALGAWNFPRVSRAHDVAEAADTRRALDGLGHGAAVLTARYGTYECFQYYLLGEGEAEKGLYAGYNVPASDVRRYLQRRGPLHLAEQRRDLPPGLRLVAVHEEDREAFTRAGFRLTPKGRSIWEIGL